MMMGLITAKNVIFNVKTVLIRLTNVLLVTNRRIYYLIANILNVYVMIQNIIIHRMIYAPIET